MNQRLDFLAITETETLLPPQTFRLRLLAVTAFVVWSLVVAGSFLWFHESEAVHKEKTALVQGLALVEKDLLYRKWVAMQGGVYAPVSEHLAPNPYLHVPERDIETPSGKKLTLVNPTYMTRLVHALAMETGGNPAYFTSLRPTHPANTPDPWERKALEWLEGNPDAPFYKEIASAPEGKALKVMVPVRAEESCLRCHTDPSDVPGTIRGGIAVTVPLKEVATAHRALYLDTVHGHVMMWLLGTAGIVLASFLMSRRVREREELLRSISRSEKFWKAVLESLQDPLIVLDRDLKVRLMNPVSAELANVKPEDAIGRPCVEVFCDWHVPSGACEQCDVQEVMEKNRASSRQIEIQLRDGIRRVFHVQTSPLKENGGQAQGAIQSFRDITQEVEARKQLAEQNRELTLLFDHMFGGFALHEIVTDDRGVPVDYRFLKVNPAFESLTGLKADEILGKTLGEILPEASPIWVERYGLTALTGEPQEFEAFEPSLGRHYSVRFYQPEPGKIAVVFFDVTDRKKGEEALRRSEIFFRELFERSVGAQLIVNPADGRILDANEAAVRLYGWSRDEIKEKFYQDVCLNPPDLIKESFSEALREEGGKLSWARHRTASGETKTVELRIGPLSLDGGLALVYVQDVTEHEKLEEQLRQAQKMQTVGQLAGGVAHEFNNLLQVINGFVEMVLSETPEDGPHRESLQKVLESGLKGAKLVQQLLAFSRKQMLRPEPLNLDELIGQFLKLAQKLVGENIRISHVPSKQVPRVNVDRNLMEQVLLNLVVNARDAMPEGGEITIETDHVVVDEEYVRRHPDASPGLHVVVAVTDTGCGMPEEVRRRVFEPFFTTKEVGKGTGLGLSVAFGIVKQHGGFLNVYSEPGRGTTFRIYLKPHDPLEAQEQEKHREEEAPRGTETILLAEDDPAVRDYLCHTLRDAGYRVLEAENGLDAVELFASTLEHVDGLIFDLVMPGMGGEEALHLIRKTARHIPAVFLSGYTGRTNGLSKVLDSNTVFVEKPVRRSTLLQTVRKLLDGQKENTRLPLQNG